MSKYVHAEADRFVALKKWKDGSEQVIEYFATQAAVVSWIAKQRKSGEFEWCVGEYE